MMLTSSNSFLVHEFTETSFRGEFKEHEFDIKLDYIDEDAGETWYIIVTSPDGGHVYDGWFNCRNITDAIAEAMIGSGLIEINTEVKNTD